MEKLNYDWYCADSADVPHCGVYETVSGNTVKEFPVNAEDAAKEHADRLNAKS